MKHEKLPTPDEQRRLLLAVFLSMLVILVFYTFVSPLKSTKQGTQPPATVATATQSPNPSNGLTNPPMVQQKIYSDRVSVTYPIETPKIKGSMSGAGLSLNNIFLTAYKKDLKSNENVKLLSDGSNGESYYFDSSWLPPVSTIEMPTEDSLWIVSGGDNKKRLVPGKPLTFRWKGNQGIEFIRAISVDENYMFSVTKTIVNYTDKETIFFPYTRITRYGHEKLDRPVVHEGPVGYIGEELYELKYPQLEKERKIEVESTEGWIGISDKYWLTAILPEQKDKKLFRFNHESFGDVHIYQMDVRGDGIIIPPHSSKFVTDNFYVGAKELKLLNKYEEVLGVKHFDLAIDFGWFYFITKPFSSFLSALGHFFKGMGIEVAFGLAILVFTVCVRLATFPLANKAFRSMNAMKKLAPEIQSAKEKFGSDAVKLQQAIMEIYKREKVTPLSGCWPMLVQIPIFFALYKTLYISIDMRQAPFWGWIHDLSAPDPTSVFNLFGIIPIDLPQALTIGIWPVLYGASMSLQMKLNPSSTDPIQQSVMKWMPWIFTYMFSQLPVGMVIYFVWSNILGMAQQYYLQKKMGMNPSFFRSSKTEEKATKENVVEAVEVKNKKGKKK